MLCWGDEAPTVSWPCRRERNRGCSRFSVAPQGCTTFLSPGWKWLLALVCMCVCESARVCLLLIF
jgi:hypothetical protein